MFKRGQVLLEYILLLGLVAVLALASFRPQGVIEQTVNTSKGYYKDGTRAILGGYYDNTGAVVMENPTGVPGGWCKFSSCINGFKVRECACPRPSFGGAECVDDGDGGAVSSNGCTGTAAGGMCDTSKNLHYIMGQGCGCYDFEYFDTATQKCTTCANAGEKNCNNVCTALTTTANCGGCGIQCPAGSTCTNGHCSADGGWSPWTQGVCSVSCGGGTRIDYRECTNPTPMFGGKECKRIDNTTGLNETRNVLCNQQVCSQDGGWTAWSPWSACSSGTQTSTRSCDNPPPSGLGNNCSALDGGNDTKTQACCTPSCPEFHHNGCSNTAHPWHANCGDSGCKNPDGSKIFCPGTSGNPVNPCPGSTGTAAGYPAGCVPMPSGSYPGYAGDPTTGYFCGSPAPSGGLNPIHGAWGDWSDFGVCTVTKVGATCGPGTQVATRTCDNPPPSNGGMNCDGTYTTTLLTESVSQDCDVLCPSVTCGTGYHVSNGVCVPDSCQVGTGCSSRICYVDSDDCGAPCEAGSGCTAALCVNGACPDICFGSILSKGVCDIASGACSYVPEPCMFGCNVAGTACAANPCPSGVVCQEKCIEGVHSYNPVCEVNTCFYTTENCQWGCLGNICASDPCLTITCPDKCTGSQLSSSGSCSNGACNYATSTCQWGCNAAGNACSTTSVKCQGVSCPDKCSTGVHSFGGACDNLTGKCVYSTETCLSGCGGTACASVACSHGACPDKCTGGNQYFNGVCTANKCTYDTQPCLYGCNGTACAVCGDGVCNGSEKCGTCVADCACASGKKCTVSNTCATCAALDRPSTIGAACQSSCGCNVASGLLCTTGYCCPAADKLPLKGQLCNQYCGCKAWEGTCKSTGANWTCQ
ncbi:MAG: thrombospondin type-1 domain-containing protein [Candidatus Omnitrophota bacterium]